MLELGTAIRIARQACGVRQSALAKAIGLSTGYLSLVEAGERNISLVLLRRIATELNIPSEALIVLAMPGTTTLSDSHASDLSRLIRETADAEQRLKAKIRKEGKHVAKRTNPRSARRRA